MHDEYETRLKSMIVTTKGGGILESTAIEVSIDDEGAGEFIVVSQIGAIRDGNAVAINPEEWPALRSAIDMMIKECRDDDDA